MSEEFYISPKSAFDATADAIRAKTGSQANIEWTDDGFADAIEDIPSGGGAVWTRPTDWPNLDALDISGGNIVYCTYLANEENGFIELTCKTSSGQYTVEIGTISGSTFTTDSTYNISSNIACRHYFGSALGGYKVVRITGNLTSLDFTTSTVYSYDGVYRYGPLAGLLEVRGKALSASIKTQNCKFIQHIYFSGTAPTNTTNLFSGCAQLVWAELPSYVTSDTTSLSDWFKSDFRLKAIDMTNWDTKNVTSLHYLFEYCYRLKDLDLSDWNVKKVTDFTEVFYSCYGLNTLNLTGWSTDAATTFKGMFSYCSCLKSIGSPIFKVGSVTETTNMFNACNLLENIDISQWDMSSVTTDNAMFNACYSMGESFTLPSSITTIGANMFASARQIYEFHITKPTLPVVPLANTNAFGQMNDAGDKKIYVPYSADHSILNAYQTATNWSTYASYIQEEPQS